jgi:hypothetical protein
MKLLSFTSIALLSVLTAGAQVGVGTTSPVSTLDVRGSVSAAVRSFTGATSIASTDYTVIFTGTSAATATLPDATACTGRVYCIKNFSSNSSVLTIATTSSQTIDGNTSWVLGQTNGSLTVTSDGANWEVYSQFTGYGSGTAWIQGGNAVGSVQKLGTTTNFDLPFITNNTEKMRIMSTGSVGIGSTSFSAKPEALLVYQNNATSINVIGGKGNLNNYLQLNIQNQNSGNTASSDLVATADNGSETTNYVDLGINSSGYSTGGVLGGHNLAYLYSQAKDFAIGNSASTFNLIFFTTNGTGSNEAMRIDQNGNVGINNSSPAANLDVNGTVKIGTAGTALNGVLRFTNQSITDNTSFNFQTTRTETFTLTGVSQYASVVVTPRGALPGTIGIAYAYASAANTVKVVLTDSNGPDALGTMAFDFTIIQ